MVVFSSNLTPNRSLYVVSVDGGAAEPFLDLPGTSCNRPIVVAPGVIAFNRGLETPNRNIFVHSTVDGSVRPLITGPTNDEWASWLPEHDLILFPTDRVGHREVFAASSSGSKHERVTASSENTENNAPSLASNGRTFVYQSNKSGDFEVILYDLESGRERNLTNSPESDDGIPVFSPDGARIAFESTRDGGLRKIHVMQADGSRVRALTTAR